MVSARKPPAQRLRCALLAALLAREARANQQLASLPSISSLPKHRRWMCRCTLHSNTRRPRQGAGRAAGGADPARRAVGRVRVVAASARAHPAAYRALRRVGDPIQPPCGLPQQAVAGPPTPTASLRAPRPTRPASCARHTAGRTVGGRGGGGFTRNVLDGYRSLQLPLPALSFCVRWPPLNRLGAQGVGAARDRAAQDGQGAHRRRTHVPRQGG